MRKLTEFVEFVVERLAPLGAVEARAMFGGFGIYVNGLFCAIAHRDTLYLKADDLNRCDFEAIGLRPFKPFADKPMTMRYFEIGADILEDQRALLAWARKALDAALRDSALSATRTKRGALKQRCAPMKSRRSLSGKA